MHNNIKNNLFTFSKRVSNYRDAIHQGVKRIFLPMNLQEGVLK